MAASMAKSVVPKLSDVICPICLCILIEPVTMPCTHELCMTCFRQNVNETSLTCPMCRTRISSWARRATRENTLINEDRWKLIQNAFPERVRRRLCGLDDEEPDDKDQDDESEFLNPLAKPGEIRKEYEEFISKAKKEEELENKRSEVLIKTLQEQDEEEEMKIKEIANRDRAIAKILTEKINEVSADEEETAVEQTLTHIADFLRPSSSTARLDFRCKAKTHKSSSRRRSRSSNDVPMHSTKSLKTKFEFPEKENNEKTSKEVLNKKTTAATDSSLELSRSVSLLSTCFDSKHVIESSETDLDSSSDESQIGLETNVRAPLVRSKSIESEDSINEELRHFRPIKVAPKTPPRRLPDGRVAEEPKLIHATPRNLMSQLDSGENSVTKPTESTWFRKRLAVMEYDRRSKVSILSNPCSSMKSIVQSSRLHQQPLPQPLAPVAQPVANFSSTSSRFVAPKARRSILLRSENKCVQTAVDKENPVHGNSFQLRRWKSRNMARVTEAKVKSDDHNNNVRCTNVGNNNNNNEELSQSRVENKKRGLNAVEIGKKHKAVDLKLNTKREDADRLLAIRVQQQLNSEISRDPYCIDRRKGTPGAYNLRQKPRIAS